MQAATGEVISAEELGGAALHTRVSGVADHLAENDAHAIALARSVISNTNRVKPAQLDVRPAVDPLYVSRQHYFCDEWLISDVYLGTTRKNFMGLLEQTSLSPLKSAM